MKQHLGLRLVSAVFFALTSGLLTDQKRYHLSKVPAQRFRVGDRFTVQTTTATESRVLSSATTIAAHRKVDFSVDWVGEAMKVDAAGQIQVLRITLVSAKVQVDARLPKPGTKNSASLRRIHFLARRNGRRFEPDTTTVVGEVTPSLKAAELELVSVADGVASIRGRGSCGFTFPAVDAILTGDLHWIKDHGEQKQTIAAQGKYNGLATRGGHGIGASDEALSAGLAAAGQGHQQLPGSRPSVQRECPREVLELHLQQRAAP